MHVTQFGKNVMTLLGAVAVAGSAAGCNDPEVPLSTNRGSGSLSPSTTVENAFIVPAYIPGQCAIQVNSGGVMRFTITNNRQVETERLLGISTSAAQTAHIVTNVNIPPNSTVSFGEPSAQPLEDNPPRSAVQLEGLDPDLRPANLADVTFQFQEAGNLTLPVPVEACPRQTSETVTSGFDGTSAPR